MRTFRRYTISRSGRLIRTVNQREIFEWLKENELATEREIMLEIYGVDLPRLSSTKKYAECLRRLLKSGKIARLAHIGNGKGYEYFTTIDNWDDPVPSEPEGVTGVPDLVENKEPVVKSGKVEDKSYRVTRSQMKQIYDIACSTWKPKIKDMIVEYGDPFSEEIILPGNQVTEMFIASLSYQEDVLYEVFPDYCRVPKNPFKEDLTVSDVNKINQILFKGDEYIIELSWSVATLIKREDLYEKSLYIDSRYKTTLHEVPGGGAVIEITKK